MERIRLLLFVLFVTVTVTTTVSADSFTTTTLTRSPALLSKLEASLLALTGRTARPQHGHGRGAADTLAIPAYLQQLFEESHGNALETTNLHLPGRFTRHANTVRSFYTDSSSESTGSGDEVLSPPAHLLFNIDAIPAGELVTGAELHITVNTTATGAKCNGKSLRITVHDITKRVKLGGGEPIMYAVDTVKPGGTEGLGVEGILSFDVFPAVQRWMAGGGSKKKTNHGLWVEVKGAKSCGVRLTSPTLFTYSADAHSRRPRSADALSRKYRSVTGGTGSGGAGGGGGGGGRGGGGGGKGRRRGGGHKHKNRKRNLCAKHKMFVDFTDVGWNDWIVAPPGYHAHHCAGECPFPMADHLNATNHAVIQALVNSMNPQLVPPPCCVPTKYSSLSLLYTDSSDKIVLKNYNEMVVDSCGCS